MSPAEINLVQTSFRRILPVADKTAALFFARLFEIDPELRQQVTGDIAAQGRKLMQSLALAVNGISQPFSIETHNAWMRAYWFLAEALRAGAREAVTRNPLAA